MIKFNKLFWQLNRIASAFAIFGLLLVISCSKDDDKPVSVATVQFTNEAQTVSENGAAVTINIPFDKAAGKAGTITVSVTEGTATEYGTHFTTSPNGTTGSFEIEVSKGQTSAQFTFTPINNALLADDKSVVFTISDVSSGFEIGTKDSNTITIIDDEGPTQANFATAASSTTENLTAGIDVTINLSSAAPGTGTVTVSFTSTTAVYTTNFTTEPAATASELEIPVAQGATSVTFKVKPVDDGSVHEARIITFTIDEATGAVVKGTAITTHVVTINDNETPSVVAFFEPSGMMSEAWLEYTVLVTLSPAATGIGSFTVTFTGGTYGEDFTTNPEAVDGKITRDVSTSGEGYSFSVIPINDDDEDDTHVITFTLSETTGVATIGSSDNTFELTIEDDDAVTPIVDLRAAYSGTADITSSLRIHGVVTSSNPQVNTNNIWVQDATGGIVVRLIDPNANVIERGDEVSIQLNGGQYFEFNGLLQVQNVPNANVTIVNEGVTLPTPEPITVAQLNSNAYEGKLVRITDVAFVDANGTATMSGTKAVSNGTLTTNVRTETTAPHASSVLPYGFGTITGLAGENLGAAQIIPISFVDDVFVNNPVGTINVTQAVTDFGSVNNGAESASQSYTVQGTGLSANANILITASVGYKVSTSAGGTYTSSLTIDAANANTLNTIFVKFMPATGVNQAIPGTITHKPLGAAAQSFAVTGTETGNGVSTIVLNEGFEYTPGTILTANGWTISGSTVTNPLTVGNGNGLTYAGYPQIGGNAVAVTTSGEDDFRTFTQIASGNAYMAFLINVSAAQATGDYFLALSASAAQTNYYARLHAKSSGSGFVLGVKKNNETNAGYGTTELAFGTTYLVVVKYAFNTGSTTDDAISVFVNPSLTAEPGTAEVNAYTEATKNDVANIGIVTLRQGSATASPTFVIDGIRVGTIWTDLFN